MGTMEFWNMKSLHEPPTYTFRTKPGEVDIDHLQKVLHEGIEFFNGQNLMNQELALLTRVIYRTKTKFRNSKDFKTLERVKKDLIKFSDIDISNKLEHLVSILPLSHDNQEIFLPTKNMVDFILVRLQGLGKILCRIMELCQLSAEFNECRFRLGHFWNLALISLGMVSRIHILSLHIIKFTCILYVRLLPFSHKLKNPGVNWLPENYIFPKDLKEWLNVDWDRLEEVIEIKDTTFDKTFFDLCDDSDDDIEYCNEYVEVDEDEDDIEIIEDSKQFSSKKTKTIYIDNSVIILRGFAADGIDTGEVILTSDGNEIGAVEPSSSLPQSKAVHTGYQLENDVDVGEVISSSDEKESEQQLSHEITKTVSSETKKGRDKNLVKEIDIRDEDVSQDNSESLILHNEDESVIEEASFRTIDIAENSLQIIEDLGVISSDEDVTSITLNNVTKNSDITRRTINQESISEQSAFLISSDEENVLETDNVAKSVDEITCSRRKPSLITCDFIPLQTNSSNNFSAKNYSSFSGGISQKFNRVIKKNSKMNQNNKGGNIINHEISGSSCTPKNKLKKKNPTRKINSNTNEFQHSNGDANELLKNKKTKPNLNTEKLTQNECKTNNGPSTSTNMVEISRASTRKRRRSKSRQSNVLLEISEQSSLHDSLPSPRMKSPGQNKKKSNNYKGKEDVPNTSTINSSKKKNLKKQRGNQPSDKELYLQQKKYLARKAKRLKKKQFKGGC